MRETAKTLDEAFNQMRVQMDFIVQSQMRQEKMLKKLYDDSNNSGNKSEDRYDKCCDNDSSV
ncbi:MAG: hypothetical protein PHD56_12610 [Anaerostipes sp.]|nr:hypothetical protein [Anaerostipes sp.]